MDESRFSKKLSGTPLYYAPEDNETLSNRIKCAKNPKSLDSNKHAVFLEREFKNVDWQKFFIYALPHEACAQI